LSTASPTHAASIPASPAGSLRLNARSRAAAAAIGVASIGLCFLRLGFAGHAFIGALFAAVLVYLAAFDLEHRLIPNRVVLPAAAVVLALQIAIYPDRSIEWLAAAAGAAGFFLLTCLVCPAGLGMGDVKLALLLGAALGTNVVGALLVGTLTAAVFGGVLLLLNGSEARKRTIAFGPFLALGAIVALLLA
jgi:prepilin signal peptidase PulO-like enzyme (type II secretory pathway)